MERCKIIPFDKRLEKIVRSVGFKISSNPDFIIVAGGDGTFARAAEKYDLPLLFVRKRGSIALHAQTSEERLANDLKKIKRAEFEIKNFLRLEFGGTQAFYDIYLFHRTLSRPLHYTLFLNNKKSYHVSSGILIATPQGSSGLNASLGYPRIKKRRILISHIIPNRSFERKFGIFKRWKILKENSIVRIKVERYGKAVVNYDGKFFGFLKELEVKKGKDAKIIVLEKESFKFAVDAVVEKNGKILLIKRAKEPFKDKWALIGGFVEKGEKDEDAIKREVREEVGLNVKKIEEFGHYFEKGRDPRGPIYSVAFEVKAKGKIKKSAEVKEVRWFKFEELRPIDLAFDHWKILLDYFKWKGLI